MIPAVDADVIVVGAGPAGSAAAYHLAQLARRVILIDRYSFPRDKSCGDGLTVPAVRLLDEMGVLARLRDAQRVSAARVMMRGRAARDFRYPDEADGGGHGLVVPRFVLDEAICRAASDAGADFRAEMTATRLIRDDGVVVGVETLRRGVVRELRSQVVIAADGASSRLRGEVQPDSTLGFAIRGYYDDIDGLSDLLELYMPLRDVTDRYLLPSYGWVFPISATAANIGVGLFERTRGESVRVLFDRFVFDLRERDPRFARARQCGAWRGAPLRFDFAPERALAPGLVFVGDAAGLISPFTGEGISYALESGKLAAETVDAAIRRGAPHDLREYEMALEQRYAGYFEMGRHGATRYRLVWRLLESTFDNEKPLFRICRRAVLFPEAVGNVRASDITDDVDPLIARGRMRVREDLLAVGEILIAAVRRDWPFLLRFTAGGHGNPGVPFRPALLLLLASYYGDPRRRTLINAAAAIELGYAAAIAHVSVGDESSGPSTRANWGNMLAVMIGDYLLSKACDLTAEIGSACTLTIARALSRVAEARACELRRRGRKRFTDDTYVSLLGEKVATLFSLPCALGADLSGAGQKVVAALTEYGNALGLAFGLADEVREIRGGVSELGLAVNPDVRNGGFSLPLLKAMRKRTAGAELRHIVKGPLMEDDVVRLHALVDQTGACEDVTLLAEQHAFRAQSALRDLPNDPVRQTLERLTRYALTRSNHLG
jgi:geranylgeranyl reductase family protein